ncbi:MAG: helix-turn-helix domain-containing protein [Gammaproteobacteria bacterium]
MTLEARQSCQSETQDGDVPASDCQSIRVCVSTRLEHYFRDLENHPCGRLYEMVMAEAEEPLLEIVLRRSDGNLSRAAQILGIHRATLRRKLNHYGLI